MPSLWNRVSLAAASFEVFEPCAALALFGFGVLSVVHVFQGIVATTSESPCSVIGPNKRQPSGAIKPGPLCLGATRLKVAPFRVVLHLAPLSLNDRSSLLIVTSGLP